MKLTKQQKKIAELQARIDVLEAEKNKRSERQSEYRQRPEVKEHAAAYSKEYWARPENKERERIRDANRDRSEYRAEYRSRPENKEYAREYRIAHKARKQGDEADWALFLIELKSKLKEARELKERMAELVDKGKEIK